MKDKTLKSLLIAITICFIPISLAWLGVLVQTVKQVDIAEYPLEVDYGVLSETQRLTMDKILFAAENGIDSITTESMTDREQKEVLSQIGLYYGSMENVGKLVTFDEDTATLNLDLFATFAENKTIIDNRIDEAISTIYEGSERYKLYQISNYIADKIAYTDGTRETIDGLNGKGVCATYAMLFYKMASRIGIQTYICYGYADEYHSWNAVKLDGRQYHYDVTFYDGVIRNGYYLHDSRAWGRTFQINNKWWVDID